MGDPTTPPCETSEKPVASLEPPPSQAMAFPAEKETQSLSKPGAADAGPPPNGGLVAWLHVVAGFMLFFNTWGLLNTFAFFQVYYESGALFEASSSEISWIGSVQAFLVLLVGMFSGPIFDRGYLRTLLVTGSFAIVFGLMMLSICTTYWQVLLAQGFCVGIGAGCLYVPCVSILPTYFSSRIGLAIGLATSGSSLGGVIYPIILYKLVDRIGFGWSVRVVAFIVLGTLLVPIAIMRLRVRVPKPRALVDRAAFTDVPYLVFTFATLLSFVGLAGVLFYLPFYAQNQHITDTRMSFYLIAVFNAASCFGRVVPNMLSDKVGPFNIITPCTLIQGVLLLCLIPVRHEAAVVVVAVLTGFFSGVVIAMPPVCFASLTRDKTVMGTRVGMGFAIISLGLLTGGPGTGGVLGSRDPLNWPGAWIFVGVSTCAAALMYAALRVHKSGLRLAVKA